MTISIATKFRNRALILLRIERIQLYEQMALLGYREERVEPMKQRGNITGRPRAFVRLENFPPQSICQTSSADPSNRSLRLKDGC